MGETKEQKLEVALTPPKEDFLFELQVRAALSSLPLFEQCSKDVLDKAVEVVDYEVFGEGDEIEMQPDAPMLIVVGGALHIGIGTGPVVDFGPGSVFNLIGTLGVRSRAEAYRPTLRAWDADDDSSPKAEPSGLATPIGSTEALASRVIPILCPHAPHQLGPEDCCEKLSGWLRVTVSARKPTTVATITPERFQEIWSVEGARQLHANLDVLIDRWLAVLRCFVLPGTPPEVAWVLAEGSEQQRFSAGEELCVEGQAGEAGEAVIVMVSGVADVLKTMPPDADNTDSAQVQTLAGGSETYAAKPCVVGALSAGAIIGDITWIGAGMPRAGTLRARTSVNVLKIPRSSLLHCLEKFPGITSAMKQRLRDVQMHVQPGLASKAAVLAMNSIFSKCAEPFLQELAKFAERRKCHCGEVLKRRHSNDTTIWFLEFGLCCVSDKANGSSDEIIGPGAVFGERTFFGHSSSALATVRVVSPFVLVLQLQQHVFKTVLRRHPAEQERFPADFGDFEFSLGLDISKLDVLRKCGQDFLNSIKGSISVRSYMPGQTITVEGAIDSGSMFALRGGRALVIMGGKVVNQMVHGETFGELAMLGVVARRTATVVAQTFCRLLEIPRATFVLAMDQHPGERDHFAELTAKRGEASSSIVWPIFVGASSHLLYHANLQTERRITSVGVWSSHRGEPLPHDVAVLVCSGCMKVIGENGELVEELRSGDSYNVQVLLGFQMAPFKLVPSDSCEVQLMSRKNFEIIMGSCEYAQYDVKRKIIREMTNKACELVHKLPRDSPKVLNFSSIFRATPTAFLKEIYATLEARMFAVDQAITKKGESGDSMFIVVDGEAYIDIGKSGRAALSGPVIGENVALGIADRYTLTVRVASRCLTFALRTPCLHEVLENYPDVRSLLHDVFDEQRFKGLEVRERIGSNTLFVGSDPEFLTVACKFAEDVFHAPGEDICLRGTDCKLGESPLWILLSGRAHVHDEHNVLISSLSPGCLFGEGGGLGLAKVRPCTVRAWHQGVTHCAQLQGSALKNAISAYPVEFQGVARLYEARQKEIYNVQDKRNKWLDSVLVPTLATNPILKYFDRDILSDIAKPLMVEDYECGDVIFEVGEPADSMILITEGEAELCTSRGDLVGRLHGGAVNGEVAALGLLTARAATLIAASPKTAWGASLPSPACRLVRVYSSLIRDALKHPKASSARQAFARLLTEKQQQVSSGLPMRAISCGLGVEHVVSRSVALHAERLSLEPDTLWKPIADDSPCGPHIGILVRGRSTLVLLCANEERDVMQLLPGGVFAEGVIAKYKGGIRGTTTCEVYHVRMTDVMLAMYGDPDSAKWFGLFKKVKRELSDKMRLRLESARAVVNSKVRQVRAGDLDRWKASQAQTWQQSSQSLRNKLAPDACAILDRFAEQHMDRKRRPLTKGASLPTLEGSHCKAVRSRSAVGVRKCTRDASLGSIPSASLTPCM